MAVVGTNHRRVKMHTCANHITSPEDAVVPVTAQASYGWVYPELLLVWDLQIVLPGKDDLLSGH